MKADSTSWKREPFISGELLSIEIDVNENEFTAIENGLIPQQMEDKWFIYYEMPYLHFHRSWTGQPVYRVSFEKKNNIYSINEALLSTEIAKNGEVEYQGELLVFLISNLLLNRGLPFPKPKKVKEQAPGIYQHHISGTGYTEKEISIKKPWWKFW